MNKYIKFDIENAKAYMKLALMNSMNNIDIGDETSIDLGRNISWNLFYYCLIKAGWKLDREIEINGPEYNFLSHWTSPTNKKVIISGSFYCGQSYKIIREYKNV